MEFAIKSKLLVRNSRFRERIESLLTYPDMGEILLPGESNMFSNCHGTVYYVIRGNSEERVEPDGEGRQKIHLLDRQYARPGYICSEIMEEFLRTECRPLSEPQLDCIIALHQPTPLVAERLPTLLEHTAIFLGIAGNFRTVFHQFNTKGQFKLDPLELYLEGHAHLGLVASYHMPIR